MTIQQTIESIRNRKLTREDLYYPDPEDQFVTTRDVKMSTRERPVGPSAWYSGPVIVPSGTVITYIGQYEFGSDPGPGFPEFEVGPDQERLHAVGYELEYVGRPIKGWCEPLSQ